MDPLFERLDLLYYVVVGLVALLPRARERALAAAGTALLGLAAAADAVGGSGAGLFTTVNELLAAGGTLLAGLSVVLWLRSGRAPPAPRRPDLELHTLPAFPDAWLLIGLALAALAPQLLLLGLGAVLALASAARQVVRARRSLWLVPLLLAALGLGIALVLMFTILGPVGGGLRSLGEGPFSLAAQRLLVLLLGGASLLLVGWLPGGRAPWGAGLVPLSAILLLRLAAPAWPDGVAALQAPAMLLLLGLLGAAAWRARWGDAALAGGLMALWSGSPGAATAGSVLVAWGWLVEIGTTLAMRRGIMLDGRWSGLATLPAGLAALPALRAGLGAQVLLSVAAVVGVVAGGVLAWTRGSPAHRAPLY